MDVQIFASTVRMIQWWGMPLLALCAASSLAVAADDCSAILEHGITNTYQYWKDKNFGSQYKQQFCDRYKMRDGTSTGVGLDTGFHMPSLNYNNQTTSDLAHDICSASSGSLTDDQVDRMLRVTIDSGVVEAWSKCERGGLVLDGQDNGDVIVLELRYKPVQTLTTNVLEGNPIVTGATCNGMLWRDGYVVDNGRKFAQCRRTGSGPVTITINGKNDSAALFVPRRIEYKEPATACNPGQAGTLTWKGQTTRPPSGQYWCLMSGPYANSPFAPACPTTASSGTCECRLQGSPFPRPGVAIGCENRVVN